MITTIALPFYSGGHLKGVVGVDMSLRDLLADVSFFGRTDSSYAFIMDSTGRLLMHPLLPSPQSVSEDPIFLYASAVEPAQEAKQVIKSMLRYKLHYFFFKLKL